ncbi:pentapeptide repeat-containing protein [Streptomyces sp. H27-H1]|uniref:pentapeptide repeat-containing protein n=1 Tax=unclassified Streptomyces TaxID=2593676 RepID=UPI00226D8746|nr:MULTISPECIES: pentapeptide repeat-containing protein [unclassified Streptomyces]MCY0929511.1 pentapeptide repeat-containing protein [Streptomyces sp. H27-H1]MCY0939658.1 pentapeptide repeat-containing protein [Streptomyces sp. H34-S4]
MISRTVGHTTVTLPALDEPGLYLTNVESLEGTRGTVQDFQYMGLNLRALELTSTRLITGRVSGLRAAQVIFEDARVDSVEFNDCDLGAAQWRNSKLSRVVFRNCKIMAGVFAELALDNVLFDKCKLDYSTFDKIRATGPVAFSGCSLDEASFSECDLADSAVEDCTLRLTEFGQGRYRGLDLRGSDLSQILGVAQLKKVLITRRQQVDLAQALAAELEVVYGAELDESN